MRDARLRIGVTLLLAGVLSATWLTVLAVPHNPRSRGFRPCPFPPCAAVCVLGAAPEVLCKEGGGPPEATTFTCCCCGGGAGNTFKPLPGN